MEFLSVLGFILPFGGLIVFLLFLVALMNEKGVSRGNAIRLAFSYVVAAVMLSIIVATGVFLLQRGLKAWVFTKADTSTTRYMSPPPAIFLASEKGLGTQTLYACTDTCQFTQTDKDQLTSWREAYQSWKQNDGRDSYASDRTKRDLASAFSFLLVSLPLFIWFFVFMVQREWKKRHAKGERPGPLRTAYFYFIAFAGLIGLVISGALLINVAMKTVFGITDDAAAPVPTMAAPLSEKQGVQSIINCTAACNFSADDKTLAQEWLSDYDRWQKNQTTSYPVNNSQSDLANLIPILVMTGPLFFYHFLTIRRESKDDDEPEAKPV